MRIDSSIYLDHQATTALDPHVFESMLPYLVELVGNAHSANHSLGWSAAQAVQNAAEKIAASVGAGVGEVFFTSGATEANNLALLGLGRRAAGGKRRRILVSAIEHKSVLATARVLREQLGYAVVTLPVDCEGRLNLQALEAVLDEDVLLVSVMAVNNEIGTIQDIAGIAAAVHKSGAFFHCDAAQAPCAVDMRSLSDHADLVSLSAHKMYGPMGIGCLVIGRGLEEQMEPLIYGGGQQRGLRSGTVPVALCVGMGAAATLASSDDGKAERMLIQSRRDVFCAQLLALPFPIRINGPESARRHPGNANVCFSGFSAHDILNALQPHVAASTGSACASGMMESSYVLKAIGLCADDAESSIRFSFGKHTSDADVFDAVRIIGKTLSRLALVGAARTGGIDRAGQPPSLGLRGTGQ